MSSFLDGPNTGGFAKKKNKGNSYRQLRGETVPKLLKVTSTSRSHICGQVNGLYTAYDWI